MQDLTHGSIPRDVLAMASMPGHHALQSIVDLQLSRRRHTAPRSAGTVGVARTLFTYRPLRFPRGCERATRRTPALCIPLDMGQNAELL